MRCRFWKRRKASLRPTEPTDRAHSPKPPISKRPTNASTTDGSHDPVGLSATAQQTLATASPLPVVESDGSASKTLLWIRAYDAICEDDPELVAAYKAVLSRKMRPEVVCDIGADSDDNAENARQEMDRQVQEGLRRTEKAAARMDKIHDGVRVVSSVKELISTAAKHAPEAAAAWAGICLLLAILENPLTESKALRDGISHVVSRMDWYWCLSRLLETTHAETSGMRDELQKHIGHLYKKLLSHQMKSVCTLFRGRASTIARDMIKLDDWANALQSVRDAETVVQRDIDTFHDSEVRALLNDISKQAIDQHAQLQDISRAIRETDQNQEERQQDERTKKCLADLRLTDPRDDMRRIEDTKGGLFRGASNWILSSDDFRRWHSADDARLLWIKGDPGKGKTMLMITIVDELERQRPTTSSTALSYFFCQGTDENLNNAAAVLRGLIYILCDQQPSLTSHLHAQYDHAGAKLFQDGNSFYALSKVLENILQDKRLHRAYLAVDALDECMTEQDQLLRFVAGPGMASPRVRWVVSSRNIPRIEDLLKAGSPEGLPGSEVRLSLEVTQNAEQVALAVSAFIDHKLLTIGSLQKDHKTRDQVRDVMREKANGTFLWVALVVDKLRRTNIWDMLEVLHELPQKLEDLYGRMIQQIRNLERKDPEFCRLVLSAAILAYRPLHLTELAIVSGLPAEISDHTDRVQKVVALCGSFLTVKESVVYVIHQSVKDYLSDRASQTVFPSSPGQVHRTMFVQSVEALSNGRLRRDMYDLRRLGTTIGNVKIPKPDPLASVRYSCIHWARHFCDARSGNSCSETEDLERIEGFIRRVFLYWLEAAALLQRMSEIIVSIRQLETALKAQSCKDQVMSLISDAVRFALHNRHEEPRWVNLKSVIESSWSPCMQTLEGHSRPVESVAFSPDGRQIASGSFDRTIKVWDRKSGACTQTLKGHGHWVHSVAFSPDGRQIASGSYDRTIKVWDCKSGACMQTLKGHGRPVLSVAFLPDGRQIASGSVDDTIKVWDCESGACTQTLEGHSGTVHSVAFSPDGRQIASGSYDRTIKVWDRESGACMQTLEGHVGPVHSVAFSRDSQEIASGSGENERPVAPSGLPAV
ncbi:uncharacterized protein DNG_03943 [Cephalotrichum gorgonifer]|uniref:Mitochondrial division protein 1 n=1 Tax=Cephalotrichum gorgonifer TaxID=2041049 RepID=A0AAE8MV40_9PEZI|nr:uncharacterized protein DNG_03943 [Cephalotrichum gorgonifer]